MLEAPITSGMRAPVDSPRNTIGTPRFFAVFFMCLSFLILIDALEAPLTVKSLASTPASRPSMRPKPPTLPSAGVVRRSSGRLETASMPDSRNVPASNRRSIRSRALSTPCALRCASFSAPPMPSARWRRAASSFSSSSKAILVPIVRAPAPVLLGAQIQLADELAPLGARRARRLGHLHRRAACGFGAVAGEARLDLGQFEDAINFRVEFGHHRRRRAGRREHAEPAGGFVTGEPRLRDGRHVGHQTRAFGTGDGERAQFS